MSEEISIMEIINIILKRWWIIAVLAVSIGFSSYLYIRLTAVPVYEASGVIYVNSKSQNPKVTTTTTNADVQYSAISASQLLIPTCMEILQSKSFLQNVSDEVSGRYTSEQIKKMMSMSSVEDTNIIKINVTSKKEHDSYLICSSIIKNAPDELIRVFDGGSVKLIDKPEEPIKPTLPNALKYGAIGALIGMVIGAVIIFAIEMFDTRIKTGEELKNKYNLPILGEIPSLYNNR